MRKQTPAETVPALPPQPKEEGDFHYRLFTGHNRTDGSFKTDEQLRMEYIQLTDNLIYKMTDGFDVINPHTGEHEKRVPDTVIFLDKSARPLAWLTRELWDKLAVDPETGNIPPMPDMNFLNIDREQWVNVVDPDGSGHMDVNKIDPSIVRSLRSIFISPQRKQEGLTESIDTTPASLDGKTIMVVDEVLSTGRTLDIATKLIRRAFPDAYVGGTHWMGGVAMKGQAVGNADLPVWYRDDSIYGRGVGERKPGGHSSSITQRLGGWFLSTRFDKPDREALQLRREIHELATRPDVPLRPSNERDDAFERLEYINGKPAKDVLAAISRIVGKPLGK